MLNAMQVLACNRQIYALKRVRFSNKDQEAIRGFIDEITLLKQLRNTPNIIQLISAQVSCEGMHSTTACDHLDAAESFGRQFH